MREMPSAFLLSNHKTKLFLSASGHITCINGREILFHSEFDRFSLRTGMKIYVNIDGILFPTVPLGIKANGFRSDFSFLSRHDMVEYHSKHQNDTKHYEIHLILSVLPDREIIEISCAVMGIYHHFSVFLSFEPILSEKYDDKHSLQSEYFPKEDILLFHRKTENDEKEIRYFGMTASVGQMRIELHSFSDCVLKSGEAPPGQGISFYLGEALGAEELCYLLDQCRKYTKHRQRRRKMKKLLQLQYNASDFLASSDILEHFLLEKFLFNPAVSNASDERIFLERYDIYGKNPMVFARIQNKTEEYNRLSLLLRAFKYHCIRGLRYDLIILYQEQRAFDTVTEIIRKAGCENLFSFSCGIYLLDENSLSDKERVLFSRASSAEILLSKNTE